MLIGTQIACGGTMRFHRLLAFSVLASAAATAALTSCAQTSPNRPSSTPARPAATAPASGIPASTAPNSVDLPGLHNVVGYADGLVSGGAPEGESGLHTLVAMGIKTVISVDGAAPDVAAAEKLGLRYVHLPISYNGVPEERATQLAQALQSMPGPIYVHCHHGKHRSAAALGTAAVIAGRLAPEQAQARMKVSGTSTDYKGLWQSVAGAKPADPRSLQVDPASLPKIAVVSGLVATMAEVDAVFDNVKVVHKASWRTPADHPDLVPTKETKRLASLFAQLQDEPESLRHPADYQAVLQRSITAAGALDAAVRGGDTAAANQQFDLLGKSCKECHKSFRDQ